MKEFAKLLLRNTAERHGVKAIKLARLYCNIDNYTALEAIGLAAEHLERPEQVGIDVFGKPMPKYKEYQKAYHRIQNKYLKQKA